MIALPTTLDEAKPIYDKFYSEWEANLKQLGVTKPPMFGTNTSMIYLYAYCHIGHAFNGKDALEFASNILNKKVTDAQSLRHMSNVNGYNARSRNGAMPDGTKLKPSYYALLDMNLTAPDWKNNRAVAVTTGNWDAVKHHYKFRCACCGSEENKPNNRKRGTITVLEKGHMDPEKPLEAGNIIPQCQICNKPYRDNVVFDANGYVWSIANTVFLERSSEKVKQACFKYLKEYFKDNT